LYIYTAITFAKIVDLTIQKAYEGFFLVFFQKKMAELFFIKKKVVPLQRNWAMV
jgi:hypothetical protein